MCKYAVGNTVQYDVDGLNYTITATHSSPAGGGCTYDLRSLDGTTTQQNVTEGHLIPVGNYVMGQHVQYDVDGKVYTVTAVHDPATSGGKTYDITSLDGTTSQTSVTDGHLVPVGT